MPQPTASDVHVNTPLTNISIAFIQDQAEFIADKIFPMLPVQKQSDRYYLYQKDAWYRSDTLERAPSTESAGSGFDIDNTPTYFSKVYAIHKDVSDDLRANADAAINPDRDATEFVTRDLMLFKEIDWASTFFTTNVWTGSSTGTDVTPGTLWSAAGSTPIEDIRAELIATKRNTGFRANNVAMGEEVWNVLQDHPDFLDRIKFVQRGIVTADIFASVLGVDKVHIGGAVRNLAQEGAALNLEFIFGKDLLVVYAPPRPGLLTPTGGYTFQWVGRVGGGMRIARFRMEHLRSDRVEGEMTFDHNLVAAEMGAFLTGVVT